MNPTLLSCSKVIQTHDITQAAPVMTLSPHKGNVSSAIWNHNNQVIASCGFDGKIVLSHAYKGTNLLTLDEDSNKSNQTNSIGFTSNSSYLASGGSDGIVKIWDLKKRGVGMSFKAHFSSIQSVHWSIDDTTIASASLLGDITLHNTNSGIQTANFSHKSSQGVKMVKFSPFKKNLLGSAGMDGSVIVWDVNARQAVATFSTSHSSRVNAIAFSTFNALLLCSASLDQKVNFYDINDRKIVRTLKTDSPLTALSFYNDGHTIAVGTLYGGVSIYDLRAGSSELMQLKGHEGTSVNYVDFVRLPQEEAIKRGLTIEENKNNQSMDSSKASSTMKSNEDPKREIPPQATSTAKQTSVDLDNSIRSTGSNLKEKDLSRVKQSEAKGTSVLDPNGEIKSKFSILDGLRKQAQEQPEQANSDKAGQERTPSSRVKKDSIGSGSFSRDQDSTRKPPALSETLLTKQQSLPSTQKKSPLLLETSEPNLNANVVRPSLERLEQKLEVQLSKLDSNKEVSEHVKLYMKDVLNENYRDTVRAITDSVQNLQLEMIRQFQIQHNEISSLFQNYFTQYNQLIQNYDQLQKENEQLRKTSY